MPSEARGQCLEKLLFNKTPRQENKDFTMAVSRGAGTLWELVIHWLSYCHPVLVMIFVEIEREMRPASFSFGVWVRAISRSFNVYEKAYCVR